MRYPARDWNICPSCGTEFGYEDVGRSYEELRVAWQARGANWWSQVELPPPGWNATIQLANLPVVRGQGYPTTIMAGNNAAGLTVWTREMQTRKKKRHSAAPPTANATNWGELVLGYCES